MKKTMKTELRVVVRSEAEKQLILKVLEYQIRAKSAKHGFSMLDDSEIAQAVEIVKRHHCELCEQLGQDGWDLRYFHE
jgi:hypothetical protein